MSIKNVLVVGGGIGGLTAAIGLRQQGINVDVVEVNAKWSVYHVGIIVQANTIRAMGHIGLDSALVAAGFPYKGVKVCDALGECNNHVEGRRLAGPQFPSDLGVTRPALHEVLTSAVKASGADIRLGVTFQSISDRESGVDVNFTDGTTRSYDLVVGADGIYSKTRELLFGETQKPKFTGQGVWRYNIPRPKDIDHAALFIGEHSKAGYVPLSETTMYVFVVSAEPGNPMLPNDQLAPLMRERLKGFGGLIGEARDTYITDSSMVVYRPLEAVMVPRPWYKGRVVLLGDAAHATSPHLGQGAAQAIEDAVVLAELAGTGRPVGDVLESYMHRRFDRCKFINEASLQIGQWELDNDPEADHAAIRKKMLDVVAQPI